MSETPASVIRHYLDGHGGRSEVPFHNLLTSWRLRDGEVVERAQMTDELAAAGVVTEPPLTDLGPDDRVVLRVVDGGEPARERFVPTPRTVAVVVAIAALGGLSGYLSGRSSGEDLDAARLAGERQGEREGAALGDRSGYRKGFERGRRTGFRQAYRRAYENASRKARP